ncbi:hypothetical protein GOV03_02120 [Candidatus Woesearchaeota archaeon]|nr:hypothetical protein [Candidatus Woesearchaeota archaeon]
MDEIKIGQALERQVDREEQGELKGALKESEGSRKDGKSILIMVGILVGVLVFSMGGFKAYDQLTGAATINIDEIHLKNIEGKLDPSEGYIYGQNSFIFADGLWWTDINRGDRWLKVRIHFGPREVEEVKIEGYPDAAFNDREEVYVAIDPVFGNKYLTLALSEVNLNMVQGLMRKPVAVCSRENETVCVDREILNCENTKGKPVIEFRWGGEPKITLDGTCILISGEDMGIVKAANRLIWQWYGVMR